jgi:hypothetical protein
LQEAPHAGHENRHVTEVDVDLIDGILGEWGDVIGADLPGYRNHAVRMAGFCFALRDCTAEERRKIQIAACFHDIGLWTARTLDYLPPSVPPAREYLRRNGLAGWSAEIEAMILEHHKLRPVTAAPSPLVELFRQGDLVDFSLGLVAFGLPRESIRRMKARYPNAGFHRTLVRMASAWFLRHPLNPAPMMKW